MQKRDVDYSALSLPVSAAMEMESANEKSKSLSTRDVLRYLLSALIGVVLFNTSYMAYESVLNTSTTRHTYTYDFWKTKNDKVIPKILYRTAPFPLRKAPTEVTNTLNKILYDNPEWVQIYFDDDDCESFVAYHYPQYKWHYDNLIPGAYKADLFRLLVIFKWGGVYNDIGHNYLAPILSVIDDNDEFVSATEETKSHSFRHALHNSFIAAYPNHPLVHYMITEITRDIEYCRLNADPLDVTGPAAIGRAFNRFFNDTGPSGDDRTPIRRGTYLKNNMKVKLLEHDPRRGIISYKGKDAIATKFPNYSDTMYKFRSTEKYSDLWVQGKVYKDLESCKEKCERCIN